MRWNSVSEKMPVPLWAVWVVTAQEPETPAVAWWDGSEWSIFVDGHGPEEGVETVTHWHIMSSPAKLPV